MNFKMQNNLSNLSKVKKYTNTDTYKVNYKYNKESYSPSENSYGDVENQHLGISNFSKLVKQTEKKIKEKILPTYNYVDFDNESLENMYAMSQSAEQSTNKPSVDLKNTQFKTVDSFNQYIKNNVENAGYGTRAGVVAAGLSLVGGYTSATGKRLRYQQTASIYPEIPYDRQDSNVEGIVNDEFYLDCSSFAWWAVYNGGYKIPTNIDGSDVVANTGFQENWATYTNAIGSLTEGKPGDFLVYNAGNQGHIVMIIGQYASGYYVAEFSSWEEGGQISKRDFTSLKNNGYKLINMDQYYNNSENVREKANNPQEYQKEEQLYSEPNQSLDSALKSTDKQAIETNAEVLNANPKNIETNTPQITIPENCGNGGYTVTVYDDWDWGYDQGKVYELWNSAGSKYDNGLATYEGRYLIACTTTFGKVGDKVDFFLEDGTKIPCIIADVKSQEVVAWDNNPANEWGHNNGQNVLEFEVSHRAFYDTYGQNNPGTNGWYDEWGGKRVVGATNLEENIIK